MDLSAITATVLLSSVLAALVREDLRSLRLPDRLTLPLVAAGVLLSAVGMTGTPIASSVLGGTVAYGVFWAVGHVHFARAGREGLGLGDAKLFAAIGTWLGLAALPPALLIASLGGLVHALARRRSGKPEIAFGPWLALAFIACWAGRLTGIL